MKHFGLQVILASHVELITRWKRMSETLLMTSHTKGKVFFDKFSSSQQTCRRSLKAYRPKFIVSCSPFSHFGIEWQKCFIDNGLNLKNLQNTKTFYLVTSKLWIVVHLKNKKKESLESFNFLMDKLKNFQLSLQYHYPKCAWDTWWKRKKSVTIKVVSLKNLNFTSILRRFLNDNWTL